jgi:hypothetical protein
MFLLTAFEKWLRSESHIGWLFLIVIFVFAICANGMAMLKRMI